MMNISKGDLAFTMSVLSLLISLGLGITAIALFAAFFLGLFARRSLR